MLDPWIIEEILKKEEERRREQERGRPSCPIDRYRDTGDEAGRHAPPEESRARCDDHRHLTTFDHERSNRPLPSVAGERSTVLRGSDRGSGAFGELDGLSTRCAAARLGTCSRSLLGVLGWGVVLALPALGVLPEPTRTDPLWIALFVVVILAARALAFRLVEGSVLSLDSAYYVAAALCVGSVGAGRLVALALTLDASVRLYYARRRERRRSRVAGGPSSATSSTSAA